MISNKRRGYRPTCDYCGAEMQPVWFTEEEVKTIGCASFKTGRIRNAVSHFECPICFKETAVDDSFDGPWHSTNKNFSE